MESGARIDEWRIGMDTYTVLLVDDEEEVLQAIRRKINWEGLGFSVIGFANNGVKALEMVEEFQPDVVLRILRCLIWTAWSWRRI